MFIARSSNPVAPFSGLKAVTLGQPSAKPHFNSKPATEGDVTTRFGSRLRQLRRDRNLTQMQMSRRFGIDRSFISEVERGRKSVSLVTLELIAMGFRMSMSDVMSEL